MPNLPPARSTDHAGVCVVSDWRAWLAAYFPEHTWAGFAPRHVRLWDWLTALERGSSAPAHIAVWPRGGAKSTSTELGCAWVCERRTRRFALYVSTTQEQADKHVTAIASLLERRRIERAVNVYGHSKGWRRQELRAANGFNCAGFGLDAGARGVKLDEVRPDLIIFDDVDARHDSIQGVRKKVETITQTIIPAGSADAAVMFVQNLIHKDSIAAQLADGRADFLLDRLPVLVEPAVRGLAYERRTQEDGTQRYVVTSGEPTWDGQTLKTCQKQMNDWGRHAFLREAQHEVSDAEHGLWVRERDIEPFRVTEAPPLMLCGVGLDPTCTSTGDEAGIITAGIAKVQNVWHAYVLSDRSLQGSPSLWAREAVTAYYSLPQGKRVFVAEKNQGGEMVEATIRTVPGAPPVELIAVHQGKEARAEPVQKLYEEGRVHHVGNFPTLEAELCGWEPGDASPNRLDALVEILTRLMLGVVPEYQYQGMSRRPSDGSIDTGIHDMPPRDDDITGRGGRMTGW